MSTDFITEELRQPRGWQQPVDAFWPRTCYTPGRMEESEVAPLRVSGILSAGQNSSDGPPPGYPAPGDFE